MSEDDLAANQRPSPLTTALAAIAREGADRARAAVLVVLMGTVLAIGISIGFLTGGRAKSADWVEAAGTWFGSLSSLVAVTIAATVFLSDKGYRDRELLLQQERERRELDQQREVDRRQEEEREESARKSADSVNLLATPMLYFQKHTEVEFQVTNDSSSVVRNVHAWLQDYPDLGGQWGEILDGERAESSSPILDEKSFVRTEDDDDLNYEVASRRILEFDLGGYRWRREGEGRPRRV